MASGATRRSVFGFPSCSVGAASTAVSASVTCAAHDDGGEVSSATGGLAAAPHARAPAHAHARAFAPYRERATEAEEGAEEAAAHKQHNARKRGRDDGDDGSGAFAGVWRRDCALRYGDEDNNDDDGGWGAAAAGGAFLVSRERLVFAADGGAADAGDPSGAGAHEGAGDGPSFLAHLTVEEALLLPCSPGRAYDAREPYDYAWHAVRNAQCARARLPAVARCSSLVLRARVAVLCTPARC
jgi:hypothetical protein